MNDLGIISAPCCGDEVYDHDLFDTDFGPCCGYCLAQRLINKGISDEDAAAIYGDNLLQYMEEMRENGPHGINAENEG